MADRTHADKTSAEDKSIGFDYQYYYFLNELINIKKGQSVGLEVMDDVHTLLDNDSLILVQLKHTLSKNVDGKPSNLSARDGDLWKTLSNWSKVVCDNAAGRSLITDQIDFLNNTHFVLASNKSDNQSNSFLVLLRRYQNSEIDHDGVASAIELLKAETKDETISGYMGDLLTLDRSVLKLFLLRVRFELGLDDIIGKCKQSIEEHHIHPSRVGDVFSVIDSALREQNFIDVKKRQKIVISYDDFCGKYRIYFDRARNADLVVRRYDEIPDKLCDFTFVRQLQDINDFKVDSDDGVFSLASQYIQAKRNLEDWVKSSDVTRAEVDELENEIVLSWENKFGSAYRKSLEPSSEYDVANDIVFSMRRQKFALAGHLLNFEICNGELYVLSDRPVIGWLRDWEAKYK